MRVLIVGSGQSGLLLAHALRDADIEVELCTPTTPEELLRGPARITQLTLPRTWQAEQDAGLGHWDEKAPRYETASLHTSGPDGTQGFVGTLPAPGGIAVDPRLKMSVWLQALSHPEIGGRVHPLGLTLTDLDRFAGLGRYDLIVVAVGAAGELGALFSDTDTSGPARQRAAAQMYVRGLAPGPGEVEVISTPHGEVYVVPTLTVHGPAHSVALIGEANGTFDCRPDLKGAQVRPRVDVAAEIMARLSVVAPDLHDRCTRTSLLEPGVTTRVRPAVRDAVGRLRGGGLVLGLGDCVVSADPSSGQGWAASTLAAALLARAIIARAEAGGPCDEAWMREAADAYWDQHGQHVTSFAGVLRAWWDDTLPPGIKGAFAAAQSDRALADAWLSSFDDPAALSRFFAALP